MKHKSVYLLCFLILPILLLASLGAYAVSNPVGEPSHAVKPKIEKYDLSHYRSLYHEEGDWNPFGDEEISRQINNVSDFFFSMTKIMASMTDYAVSSLFQLDVIDNFADKIGLFVGDIYQKMMSNMALTLFIIVCFNAFIIFSVKGDAREAIKRGFLIFCLVGFGVGILANAGTIIRGTNNLGKDLNNIIMNSTSSIDGNVDYLNENSGMNHIRNQYFDMTVYRTYLVMNYGTVNEKDIKAKGKDRIDNILKEDFSKDGKEKIDNIIKKEVEEKGINNKYMSQGYAFQKLAISVIGCCITLFLSIVFLFISFAKLIFSTFALILFLFLVFSWIVSFLPGFELSVFSAFAKTLGYIILSACMTFLFVVVGLCIDLANTFIVPDSQDAYFLNSIFVIVILIVLYKKRAQIINFISRGNVSFSPGQIGASAMRQTQEHWNKMRSKQSQDKRQKRQDQQPTQPEKAQESDNENQVKRNQQRNNEPVSIDKKRGSMKRSQQQIQRQGQAYQTSSKKAGVSKRNAPVSNNSKSNQPQKSEQQERQVREVQQRKPIERSRQKETSVRQNSSARVERSPQQARQHERQSEQHHKEKRQLQSNDNRHMKRQENYHTSDVKRSSQSKERLKEQREVNKHGR
ncbi:CD3337/EF1877 family mobilome membrane protein [Staphylococcus simulans]|uniref:CD3337/EF1877 family mobilome membrane protein n=1 Tax=Staphylococcus simulans TaxID=1286 RepID=UPI000D1F0ED9|nr:hypothetical protein [Staphylococcus simulans]PTJ92261.1 hypothetical protein BU032_02915 [Staphylococcus simulans]